MALSKDEVIEIVNGFLKVIRQKHDVREAYLFGSFAQGTPKEYSDIDLAIVLGSVRSSDVLPFDEGFEIFHEAQRFNSLIEVVSFRQEEFVDDGGSLVKRIKKEGIRLI
jgi:predicted nucleotidyltransferase